jgi:cell division protein FtsL
MVPWISIVFSTIVLAALMVMVVCQRAELVKYQYALVDLRQARLATVKERAELRLQIQRLSALERIDGVAGRIGMVRPPQRLVLDMTDTLGHAVAINNNKKIDRPVH